MACLPERFGRAGQRLCQAGSHYFNPVRRCHAAKSQKAADPPGYDDNNNRVHINGMFSLGPVA